MRYRLSSPMARGLSRHAGEITSSGALDAGTPD
jgi:hypothetical protein